MAQLIKTQNWISINGALRNLIYVHSYTIELLPSSDDRFEIIFLDRYNEYVGNSPYVAKENIQNSAFMVLF